MLKEEFLFAGKYKLKKQLGRGGFSEVWLAQDTMTNVDVAVKVYAAQARLEEEGIEIFRKEFALVFGLNHTNLLHPTYFDVWENMPYLILPYCKEGSVFKFISKKIPITEEQCWNLLHDVAAGLSYMHERTPPLIHQDIKPDNILISDEGRYMITDFGISTKVRNTIATMQNAAQSMSSGTLAYMGPERFSTKPKPLMASDVWSLGAMMYELMTGGNPPFGNHGGALQKNGADIPEIEETQFSDQLKEMVYWCMAGNTWDRPTARLVEELAYKKLHGMDITAEMEKNRPKDKSDNRPTTVANLHRDYSGGASQQPRPSQQNVHEPRYSQQDVQQPRPSGYYDPQPRPSGYYDPQPRPSGNYEQQPRPSGNYGQQPRQSGNYQFDPNVHGTHMDRSHMGGESRVGKKNNWALYGGIGAAAVVVIVMLLWFGLGSGTAEKPVPIEIVDTSELLRIATDASGYMKSGETSLALKKQNNQLADDTNGAVESDFLNALDSYDKLKTTEGYSQMDPDFKAEVDQNYTKAKNSLKEIHKAIKEQMDTWKKEFGEDDTYKKLSTRAKTIEARIN